MANIYLALLGLILAYANAAHSGHSNKLIKRKTDVGNPEDQGAVNNSWSSVDLGKGQKLFTHIWIGTDENSHQCELKPKDKINIKKTTKFDKFSHVGKTDRYKTHKEFMYKHLNMLREKCSEISNREICLQILESFNNDMSLTTPYSVEIKKTVYFEPEKEIPSIKKNKNKTNSKSNLFGLFKNIKDRKNSKDKIKTSEDVKDDEVETQKEKKIKLNHDKISTIIVNDKNSKLSDRDKYINTVHNKAKKEKEKIEKEKKKESKKPKQSEKQKNTKDKIDSEKEKAKVSEEKIRNLVKKQLASPDVDNKKVDISYKPTQKPGKDKSHLLPIEKVKTKNIENALKDINKSKNETQVVVLNIEKNKKGSKQNITISGNLPVGNKSAVVILKHPKNWKGSPKLTISQIKKNQTLIETFDDAEQFELTIRYNATIKNSTEKEVKVIKLLIDSNGNVIKGTDGKKDEPKKRIKNISQKKLAPTMAIKTVLKKLDNLGVQSTKIEVIRKKVQKKEVKKVLKKLERTQSKYEVDSASGKVRRIRKPKFIKNKMLRNLFEELNLEDTRNVASDAEKSKESKNYQTREANNEKTSSGTSVLINKNRQISYFGKQLALKKQFMPYKLSPPHRESKISKGEASVSIKRKTAFNKHKRERLQKAKSLKRKENLKPSTHRKSKILKGGASVTTKRKTSFNKHKRERLQKGKSTKRREELKHSPHRKSKILYDGTSIDTKRKIAFNNHKRERLQKSKSTKRSEDLEDCPYTQKYFKLLKKFETLKN